MRLKIIYIISLIFIIFTLINGIAAIDLENQSLETINCEKNDNSIILNKLNDNLENSGDLGEANESNDFIEIYVGQNKTENGGNGSYDNPFSTLDDACDFANTQNKSRTVLNVFNGTYYLKSHLIFNTSNLIINGVNGSVIIKNMYGQHSPDNHTMAFGLVSTSSNYTMSNIIYDASEYMPAVTNANSHFFLFEGTANSAKYYNCSFLGLTTTRFRSGATFNELFYNCYFEGSIASNKNLYSQQLSRNTNHTFINCRFNLPNLGRFTTINLPCNISMIDCWFGKNALPSYITPNNRYVKDENNKYVTGYIIPVTRYAFFSVSENYLGNNQFEIIGKLTWNGTENQEGMENFQPMNVKLSSKTGNISETAILTNGTFKAIYTGNSSEHNIVATLHYQPVELNFKSIDFTVDAPSIFYGEDQNVTVTFPEIITNNITITVNNKTYDVEVNNTNSTTFTIEDRLTEGNYTVTVSYLDDINKVHGLNSTVLTVSKVNNYVFDVVPSSEVKVGENATIAITLPEDVEGNVTIKFGNDTKTLPANQTMVVNFNNLNATTYSVTVTYTGSDKYTGKEKVDSITVDKADSSVSVDDSVFTYGDVIAIPFNVTNASGINVRVLNKDGVEVANTTSKGAEFVLDTLAAGKYTLEVTTIVNDNYEEFTADNINLTINKAESDLTLNDSYEFTYGENAVINVITENSTGDVIVSLDGFAPNVSGNAITLPKLNVGKYTLNVTTNPDENHNNATKSTTITIIKANPSMNVIVKPVENITTKDDVTLTISLPSDATGEVTVKINGKKTDIKSANETITLNLNNQAGDYVVDVAYSGDKNYESDMATQEYAVSKSETSITAQQIASEEGTATIEVNITDVDSGIVLVDVDGKKFYGEINNGKATVNIEGVPEGNYTANIKFAGDEKYNLAATTADIKIAEGKIITDLKEQLEEANAKVDNLTAELNESQANATKLSEDLADANAKVDNLTAELNESQANATKLADDLADANAKVDNLTAELEKAKLLPTQFNVTNGFKLQVYAVDYKAGERGEMFNVLLTDSNGNPLANQTVFFAINGWVHNKTTDANGVAHLQINLQDANYYTCAPCYLGNTSYNATFASAMLEVVKKPITISAAAKSYKATAKTKKYTVTLKTIKGSSADGKTYLSAGKKVTLKVNGKTYTAKINAKGQATFNLKITKKGKYDATIKFAGDKTYNSASKKVKITIK